MGFFKRKYSKIVPLIFILLLILTNTCVYAQLFTDVPDNYWAAEYIKKVKDLGIITGYPDATFKPTSEVTKLHSLVMISRLYKLDNDAIADIRNKYQELLDELGVESWAQDGIAVALSSGIISEEVLKEYYKSEKAKIPATKEEICIFLTRAMGLEEEAKSKTIIILPFKDAELIPAQVAPYVDMMIQKGIINEKGDSEGKFNPKSSMNRAMMAKVLSVAYDYIQENKVTQQIFNDTEIKGKKTITVSGTIVSILKATNEVYITIEDEDGHKNVYIVDSNTDITLDDEDIKFTDLVEGLIVEAKIIEGQRVISINAESTEEEYSGKVKSLILTTPAILTIEYEEDGKNKTKGFYIASDVDITLNAKDAFIYNINEGDLVDLKVKNNRIVEIIAESKDKHIEGFIKEIKYDPEPKLVVEDNNGLVYEFSIDKKADIERDNKNAEITDLKIGDEVEIDVEYDVITDIEAKIVKGEDEGIIKAILISNRPELTILNKDGKEATYYISNGVNIEIDNKNKTIYDLRLGYYVELDIESNEIVSLDAEVREHNDRYTGTVEYINEDAGVIVLSVINPNTGEKENIRIDITSKTTFIDTVGSTVKLRYVDIGDEVIVIGTYDGGIFTAKTVILIQNNN